MILHCEHRTPPMTQPFNGAVVEVHMGDLDLVGQRVGIDGEPVILTGDLDALGRQVLDRMVDAPMAELQLERAPPER